MTFSPFPPPVAPARERDTSAEASLSLIFLLAAATALGPFALQALAPGLPRLSVALAVPESAAQMMISLSMAATALGAVVYGPISDRYGRRPVLLAAAALSTGGATLSALAPNFEVALIGRLIQAIGGGAGMVLARAAARDLFGATGAAAMIARITAAMVIAPMIAPAVGGVAVEFAGWRGIFLLTALISFGLGVWIWMGFAETVQRFSPRLDLSSALSDYAKIAWRRAFWADASYAALSLASFFLFVSGGPYVMERAFNVGPGLYGVFFFIAAAFYMGANLLSPMITERVGRRGAILLGAWIGAAGPAASTAFLFFHEASAELAPGAIDWAAAAAFVFAVTANSIGAGVAVPNAVAGAVSAYPERAGSASSLLSVVQFSIAGVAAQSATWFPLDVGWALCLGMTILGAAAALTCWALWPRRVVGDEF